MLSLNIHSSIVSLRDIKYENLPQILNWYNNTDDFSYATGIDHTMTLDELKRKYAEVAISSNEFFNGIYKRDNGLMIGILKGRLNHETTCNLWINSIAIDPAFQSMGYGSGALDLILDHMKLNHEVKKAYITVIDGNLKGKCFWEKNGFFVLRIIEKHLLLREKYQNVLLMHRFI